MDLHLLRSFAAVAQAGHLTRAAEKLFISQPAVSAHVKALEVELGVTLFARTSKGMQLTREGALLLPQAESVLAKAEELRQLARSLSQDVRGELRLALHTDPQFLRVLELLEQLRQTHPNIEAHLCQSASWVISDDIRTGRLDGGFSYCLEPPEGDLAGMRITATELFVVAPPKWQERILGASWNELAREPWVWFTDSCPYSPLLARCLGSRSRSVHRAAVTDYEETLRALVSSGVGLSLMRQDEAQRYEQSGEVCIWGGSGQLLEIYFLYRRDREPDPALRAVLSTLRNIWGLTASGCA